MDKLAMGGYGIYVWSSFVLAFIVLLFNEWRARRRFHRTYREIEVRIKALGDRV